MRFIFITSLSLFLVFNLQGQKTFASRALNYHWLFKKYIWTNVSSRHSAYIDTATIVLNGKNYQTLIEAGSNFKIADSGSCVYGSKGTQEYLLMNYNLNLGDTLRTNIGSSKFQLQVRHKSKIKIEGDSLWYFELKSVAHPINSLPLIWIESIGCISGYHPLNWPSIMGFSDISFGLDCVLHNDTSILKSIGRNCSLQSNLINPKKIWYTWASNHNGDLKFSVKYYFVNQDTLINGKKYKIMNQPSRFVRYDTFNGKYYILSNNLGEEMMVFNEKANVGDTIFETPYSADTVSKISYGWFQDVYRKIYTTPRDAFISGIGSEKRVMWDNHLVSFPEYQAGNICYQEGSTINYHYPFFYDNNNRCDFTSNIHYASINSITIFPNPVLNVLNFSTSDKKEFKIRNSLGILILEGVCEEKIDVAVLTQGIYFLELMDKSRSDFFKFQK